MSASWCINTTSYCFFLAGSPYKHWPASNLLKLQQPRTTLWRGMIACYLPARRPVIRPVVYLANKETCNQVYNLSACFARWGPRLGMRSGGGLVGKCQGLWVRSRIWPPGCSAPLWLRGRCWRGWGQEGERSPPDPQQTIPSCKGPKSCCSRF